MTGGVRAKLARAALKSTARHTARGTASKAKRSPLRSLTLLGIGGAVGAAAGWLAGRKVPVPTGN
jgi:fructose-specific phosphotransferase system IIC component